MQNKSKLTLIVDGNWLLMSRLSVLNNRYKDELELCQELKLLMLKSMGVVLRQFPLIDNIIFVSDGGSWRNKLDIPEFLKNENIEYKGNRERSDDINWELVFEEFESFMSILSTTGITVSREQGIEGDDWCWYWSTKLNSENTNCIIWSKDKDLTQLVKTNSDNCFTIWWNKESGAYVENKPDEEMNFLFNFKYNENEQIYREVINSSKIETKIKPKDVIIDKIIRGDLGDNIIPIIYRKSKSNTNKQFRVSVKDLPENIDIHNQGDIQLYLNNLLNSKSYLDRVDKSLEDIFEHFNYNVKLVELSELNYPEYILDIFDKYSEYTICNDISIAENQIRANSNKLKDVLDFI
jgi:5'-3' exonuclease